MTTVQSSSHRRRTILLAIELAIPVVERRQRPGHAPPYPDSVPDIDQHLDDLVQFIRDDNYRNESPAARIRSGICDACPHQFPERYCPLRHSGGCIPFRFAEQIGRAVSGVLGESG
jgi:hypothetical protein